jgi:predicted O-methyltransferase YrrM
MRKELETISRFIKRKDLGALCRDYPSDQRFVRVRDIARHSAVTSRKGELLFRLVKWLDPDGIIELGTSLGISTMYLSLAIPGKTLVTIEGCFDSANIARENFDKHNQKNIRVLTGDFKDKLAEAFSLVPCPGLIFFDGDHRKQATLDYFEQSLQHIRNESVFVIDDIHWSSGMEEAWKEICQHPRTKVCVDLFYFGIVFFREELSKENFILRF